MSNWDDIDDNFFDDIFGEEEIDDLSIEVGLEQATKPKSNKEFVVNDYITLRLENNQTNIYIDGKLFRQCKHLLFNIPSENLENYDEINSIDDAEVYGEIANNIYPFGANISPETEFIGHCSNLQAWAENNYDTRILHSNIAFPLLKRLYEAGDPQAKKIFTEQILERFMTGHQTTVTFLIEEDYIRFLEEEDRQILIEDPSSQLITTLFELLKKGRNLTRINIIMFFFRCGNVGYKFIEENLVRILPYLDTIELFNLIDMLREKVDLFELTRFFKENATNFIRAFRTQFFNLLEKDYRFESDIKVLYDLINLTCNIIFSEEKRWIEKDTFNSTLTKYYEDKGCGVYFHLSETHNYNIFHIEAKESFYFYDLSRFKSNTYIENKGFWEFSNVYFKDECVIIRDMFQLTSDQFPMQFIVKCYKQCSENLIELMETIREILTETTVESILEIKEKLIKFLENEIPVQEKYYALYYVISHVFFTFFVEEIRVVEYTTFISMITEYYDKLNCDVDFSINAERERIQLFKVRPQNKYYYYDKLEAKEYLKELKYILFPDEDIKIKWIRPLESNGNLIQLKIEKKFIDNLTLSYSF